MKNLLLVFLLYLTSVTCEESYFNNFQNSLNLTQIFSNFGINKIPTQYDVNQFLDSLKGNQMAENKCFEQFRLLFEGIVKHELWALQMFDASAKLESGLLYGNIFSFGNFDECLAVKHAYMNRSVLLKNETLKGQYCKSYVTFTGEKIKTEIMSAIKLVFGLCVPSGCTGHDLQTIGDILVNSSEIKTKFGDQYCYTEDTVKDISISNIIGIAIFGLFSYVLLHATLADMYNLKGNNAVLRCFSMYSNGKKLLKISKNEDALNCLNGIRVLSMFLIVLAHRTILSAETAAINRIFVETWKDYWYNYILIGLGFAVDTFFVVSGLLVVYLFFRAVDKGRDIPWGMYYVHRILRLSPSLTMVVVFYLTMLTFLEQPPLTVINDRFGSSCREYWWTTLLYIQNYWNPNDMCVVQSWYLAIDTHLYFLAPILLLSLKKFPMKTTWGIIILICLSMAAAFEITWEKELGATYLNQNPEEYKYLYTPTHIRMTPWLLGALLGYYIAKNKDKSYPMHKGLVYCLWILAFGAQLFVLLIQQAYHNTEYSVISSGIFNAFSRTVWSAGICGMIWLCVFGHGGLINSFLSCSVFNILIRINYAVFLVHFMIIATIAAGIRTPVFLSDFYVIHETLGDYFLVIIIATIWTLAFESPIIGLEKIIFSKGEVKKIGNFAGNVNAAFKDNCDTVVVK